MKIIKITQGTNEWLTWRHSGICASDISALMGSNPYKNALQIFEIKCGFKKEGFVNKAMQHGTDNEPRVRDSVNEKLSLNLQNICVESKDRPYFKASLDGFDTEKQVLVEIKCPVSPKILGGFKNNIIPPYWVDQIQWQIMLTNPTIAHLVVLDYVTNDLMFFVIERDDQRINEMKTIAEDFWIKLVRGESPKSKFVESNDEELKYILNKYHEFSIKEGENKKYKNEMKEKILQISDGHEISCAGFTISKMKNRFTYDIDAMINDGIDVSKYKKESTSEVYRINTPKFSEENNTILC
jgi:putative phage-type endonuclease